MEVSGFVRLSGLASSPRKLSDSRSNTSRNTEVVPRFRVYIASALEQATIARPMRRGDRTVESNARHCKRLMPQLKQWYTWIGDV